MMGCAQAPKATREGAVTMKKYSIEPAEVHLKRGETAECRVSTTDVQHGFSEPTLGINEPVQPSHAAVFTFTATSKGEFEIKGGIICGGGHDRMRARLVSDLSLLAVCI